MKCLPLLLAVLLSMSYAGDRAQAPRSHPQSTQPHIAGGSEMAPRTQFAPYYTTEKFEAMLMLNNATSMDLDISPTLYSPEGEPASLAKIHLAAHDTKSLDLNSQVSKLKGKFKTGSVRLDYTGTLNAVGAMVMMMNEADSLELDVLLRDPQTFRSTSLEGIWWTPYDAVRVLAVLQNTTTRTITASVNITARSGEPLKSTVISLSPHETREFNLAELGRGRKENLGGISVTHSDVPGALMAQAFAVDQKRGFSINLPVHDPLMVGSSTLDGAGVLLGADSGDAKINYTGHLLLRNVSTNSLHATALLQRGQLKYDLGSVDLQPGEAREIAVDPASLPSDTQAAGVHVESTGASGDLVGFWFSTDETGDLSIETPLRSMMRGEARGGNNPWDISGDQTSTLYVKNTGSEKSTFVAQIRYPGGVYVIGGRSVDPGETFSLDIRKLRDNKVPDEHGKTIPVSVTAGQVFWHWTSGPQLVGRVNTVSKIMRLANNMSCSSCGCACPYTSWVDLNPVSWTALSGDTVPFVAEKSINDGCSISTEYVDPNALSWDSTNTSVATASPGAASCIGPGTTTIRAAYTYENYQIGVIYSTAPCDYDCSDQSFGYYATSSGMVIPYISSITPPRGLIGTSVSVTISGSGFNGSGLSVSAGSGITVTINSSGSTQIQATFAIASNAPSGNHSVTVTAGGQTSVAKVFYVQIPTASRIVSQLFSYAINSSSTPSCPTGQAGWYRKVLKIVTDQSGTDITQDPQGLTEVVTLGARNDLQIGGVTTGTATTSAGGYFSDILQVCSPVCPANSGETDASQVITDTPPSSSSNYQLSTNSFVYKCTGNTINGQ